jgi:hypothetical protein
VFIYDVSDRHSFDRLQNWFGEVKRCARATGVVKFKFLLGNKTDLNRVVSVDEAKVFFVMCVFFDLMQLKELAAAHGCHYFEVR